MICVKEAGLDFPSDLVENSAAYNRDGAGFAFCKNGEMIVRKKMGTPEEIKKMYEEIVEETNNGLIVYHVRLASHGDTTEAECHPHYVTKKEWGDPKDIVMFHNGVVSGVQYKKNWSDTHCLVEGWLRPIFQRNPQIYKDPDFMDLIGAFNSGSKFVFFTSDNEYVIVNEPNGEYWKDHVATKSEMDDKNFKPRQWVWISNEHSIKPKVTVYSSSSPNYGYAGQHNSHSAYGGGGATVLEAERWVNGFFEKVKFTFDEVKKYSVETITERRTIAEEKAKRGNTYVQNFENLHSKEIEDIVTKIGFVPPAPTKGAYKKAKKTHWGKWVREGSAFVYTDGEVEPRTQSEEAIAAASVKVVTHEAGVIEGSLVNEEFLLSEEDYAIDTEFMEQCDYRGVLEIVHEQAQDVAEWIIHAFEKEDYEDQLKFDTPEQLTQYVLDFPHIVTNWIVDQLGIPEEIA